MNTYDMGAGTHGGRSAMRSLWVTIKRCIDRERELISLRNAVGMMSEARRSDAYEYEQMAQAMRNYRADSIRLRWLTKDHADPAARAHCRRILDSMATRSYSGVCIDVDGAMADEEAIGHAL